MHARRLGYHNALVLSMDTELHTELKRRHLPTANNAANLDRWNTTCLQRHIQAVRMERQLDHMDEEFERPPAAAGV